ASRGVAQSSPSRQPRIAWKWSLTWTDRSLRAHSRRISSGSRMVGPVIVALRSRFATDISPAAPDGQPPQRLLLRAGHVGQQRQVFLLGAPLQAELVVQAAVALERQ